MYENGRQINRYAAKMIHQRKMKFRYLHAKFGFGRGQSWDEYAAHCDDEWYLKYWHTWYYSGRRTLAQRCSNRKLRNEFREETASRDWENMYAPQYGNYKKHFEYWWMIF